jgi:hypothetical protein
MLVVLAALVVLVVLAVLVVVLAVVEEVRSCCSSQGNSKACIQGSARIRLGSGSPSPGSLDVRLRSQTTAADGRAQQPAGSRASPQANAAASGWRVPTLTMARTQTRREAASQRERAAPSTRRGKVSPN